jgi:NADH-quinone oxidoreductase subunit F
VTVYEAAPEAGGILRWGIPDYRLPKLVLKKEIDFVKKMGVKFVFNRTVDAAGLAKLAYGADAVFMATGAYKSMSLNIPGEKFTGVMPGTAFLDSLQKKRKPAIGREVLVIGAGNVAIDAARSAWRLGAKATVVYRREKDDMPANKDEIREAENEGIKFIFLAAPKEILAGADGRVRALRVEKMTPGEFDVSGRRRPLPTGQTYEIAGDTVMVAIGERVDAGLLEQAGLKVHKDGTLDINDFTMKASAPKFYAGGDLVTGPSTAVEAMADGKKAAQEMDRELTGTDRFAQLFRKFEYAMTVPAIPGGGKKQEARRIPVSKRLKNFKEVSLGLSGSQAQFEAQRCLRCDVKTPDA